MESISDAPDIPEGLQVDPELREELLAKEDLDDKTEESFDLVSNIRRRARVLSGDRKPSDITVYPDVNWSRPKREEMH